MTRRRRNNNCFKCGCPVSGGGDRHAIGRCGRTESPYGRSRNLRQKDARPRIDRAVGTEAPERGVPVAGTGKLSASSQRKAA